jgi:hypothetical protein
MTKALAKSAIEGIPWAHLEKVGERQEILNGK